MLNFDKMREITQKMKTESYAYAENFLQRIFDNLEFLENDPFDHCLEYDNNQKRPPNGADPECHFNCLDLGLIYARTGLLEVYFRKSDLGYNAKYNSETEEMEQYTFDTHDKNPYYHSIQEVLLNNGFIKEESKDTITFTRVI